ncbi:uncharacterized protein [Dermacentor andersoni]|uniref:uncharacterized protein isoform X1 n=2 Tax=Dermacentor andersoni TaxID=34620 RepID=UPI002416F84C|nr:interferon alpha-inducible protein 27-like protein 2B isoform X1 [Dermacentor andersoni]
MIQILLVCGSKGVLPHSDRGTMAAKLQVPDFVTAFHAAQEKDRVRQQMRLPMHSSMASALLDNSGHEELRITKDQDSNTKSMILGSTPENFGGHDSLASHLSSIANKVGNMANRKTLVTAAAATVGAAAAVAAVPVVLSAVGFGTAGVSAGSTAAGIQSTMGGFIAKGSLFSLCQSWGAVGLPAATQAATAVAGAGLGGGAAAVGASTTVQSGAAKMGACLKTAASTTAAVVPAAVWFVASKTGTCLGSATAAVKAGAVAAGMHLGIGGTDAAADALDKLPAARL